MKPHTSLIILTLAAANALAQGTIRPYEPLPLEPPIPVVLQLPPPGGGGTVNFATRVAADNLNAPVYDVDGVTKVGSAFSAQLYAGLVPDSLAPVGSPVAFKTGLLLGYVSAGEVALPWPGGTTVFVQMRYWTGGATYDAAKSALGGKWGESNIISVKLGTPPLELPPSLVGLQMCIPIPEPPATALALLGTAALLLRFGGLKLRRGPD